MEVGSFDDFHRWPLGRRNVNPNMIILLVCILVIKVDM